jgi:DNA-binding MarR family transcriptional regulator
MLTINIYAFNMNCSLPSFSRDIGTKVHKLACLMGRTAEHALMQTVNLSFSQFRMLMALHHGRDLTQKRIATFHGITEAAVSRQIEILKEKKLITAVENSQNRRERKLALTSRGIACMQKAQKTLERAFLKPFNRLSSDKKMQLNTLLQTLVGALEEQQSSKL